MPPNEHTSDNAPSSQKWQAVGIVVGLLILLLAFYGACAFRSPRARQDPWLFIHVMSLVAGYLLCYGIGILANCYSIQRCLHGVSAGQTHAWRRAQKWMSLVSFGLILVGLATGAMWAKSELGRYWDWDPKEVAPLVVLGWQVALYLSLRWTAPRWLIYCGIIDAIVVTYAWFLPNLTPVTTVAVLQAPALICGLSRNGWLPNLSSRWVRYRANKCMAPYRE